MYLFYPRISFSSYEWVNRTLHPYAPALAEPRPLGAVHTSLNSRGRLSVGCSSAALRYMSLAALLLSWACGGSSCSGWYMGGGRVRWSGQRGSADWPKWTVRSHGTSFRPGQVLKRTWLASWRMSGGEAPRWSRPSHMTMTTTNNPQHTEKNQCKDQSR